MKDRMTDMEEIQQEVAQDIVETMEQAEPEAQGTEKDAPVRNRYADLMNRPKRQIPKPVKIGLAVLIVAGLFAGGVYLVRKTGEEPPKVNGETTAIASRGFLETYIEGDGEIQARTQVELGKELKGKVTEVLVQAGQAVKAGDKLFTVDPTEIREELDTARKDMQEAQRALDEAASGVTAARKQVAELTTTAPFSGRMLPPEGEEKPKTWRVGDEMPGGTVLGTLVDDTTMKLPLYFSYAYVDAIQKGAAVTVSIPANMSTVPGKVESVERIEKVSDDGTRLFRITVSMNNPGALKKGMSATAEVSTAGGKVMPAEAGVLEYSREETVTAKQSGEITQISGLDYYKFSTGAAIVQQKNEDLTRAVETAVRTLESQQQAIVEKQKRITELETLMAGAAVTSPIDGVVLKMDTAVDAELAGGTAPCVVADMSTLVVKAKIMMNDINLVMPGQMATLTMNNGNEEVPLTGTVESVSMQAEENSGNGGMPTYTAVIVLDPLPEGMSVSMGYYVSYKITTAQSPDCITIPTRALVNTVDGTAVFAKPAEGQEFEETIPIPEGTEDIPEEFVLVPVSVGISDSTSVEILSGIDEGTEVFLSGPSDLYEDMNAGGEAVAVG
ncbi:MAG: HlyD family efflux transporter periplasmic adaptor subunit [Clostridiaceae bacterium]|nr:HlyD family efflux transporter periplasmic adaptor subunit [Clostridiaceae bacterium]